MTPLRVREGRARGGALCGLCPSHTRTPKFLLGDFYANRLMRVHAGFQANQEIQMIVCSSTELVASRFSVALLSTVLRPPRGPNMSELSRLLPPRGPVLDHMALSDKMDLPPRGPKSLFVLLPPRGPLSMLRPPRGPEMSLPPRGPLKMALPPLGPSGLSKIVDLPPRGPNSIDRPPRGPKKSKTDLPLSSLESLSVASLPPRGPLADRASLLPGAPLLTSSVVLESETPLPPLGATSALISLPPRGPFIDEVSDFLTVPVEDFFSSESSTPNRPFASVSTDLPPRGPPFSTDLPPRGPWTFPMVLPPRGPMTSSLRDLPPRGPASFSRDLPPLGP
ncbi:hypothetical protein P5673_000170 [Acropora cervicornis]|uniref:Uncharacterized protein n=1 Tax=Acropora cervicornis TaxID=6130 RepID=A0AAD9R6Q2_ACRCE|nr:hypothetical protein P5673_000170 [Acropora cervicornis]